MENDVIVEFNKTTIDDAAELTEAVRKTEPGTKAIGDRRTQGSEARPSRCTVGSLPSPQDSRSAPRIPMPTTAHERLLFDERGERARRSWN